MSDEKVVKKNKPVRQTPASISKVKASGAVKSSAKAPAKIVKKVSGKGAVASKPVAKATKRPSAGATTKVAVKTGAKPVKKKVVRPVSSAGSSAGAKKVLHKSVSQEEKKILGNSVVKRTGAVKVASKPVERTGSKPVLQKGLKVASASSEMPSKSEATSGKNGIRKLGDGQFAKVVRVRKKDGTIGKKLVRCDENGNILGPLKKQEESKESAASRILEAVTKASLSDVERAERVEKEESVKAQSDEEKQPEASANVIEPQKEVQKIPVEEKPEEEKTEEVEQEKSEQVDSSNIRQKLDRTELLSRVKSRHSFLSALEQGKRASDASKIETAEVEEEKPNEQSGPAMEEEIEVDKDVSSLENKVLGKQYKNMTGKGDSKGVSTSASQLGVSAQAQNPNASKGLGAVSTADSVKSQNLTGSYVNMLSKNAGVVLPEADRKVKERKHVNPVVVFTAVAAAIVVAFVAVFLFTFNFGVRNVYLLTYELTTTETARYRYYDGELIDFGGVGMEFLTNGAEPELVSLSLKNLEPQIVGEGFVVQDGSILIDWSGENKLKNKVDIKVPVSCRERTDFLHLTVFRNKLVGLTTPSVVSSLSTGTAIYPNMFGIYENAEILGEKQLTIALDVSEYTLLANIGMAHDPVWVDLKDVDGAFDEQTRSFVIPSKVDGALVSVVGLKARYTGMYFNAGGEDIYVAEPDDNFVEIVLV